MVPMPAVPTCNEVALREPQVVDPVTESVPGIDTRPAVVIDMRTVADVFPRDRMAKRRAMLKELEERNHRSPSVARVRSLS